MIHLIVGQLNNFDYHLYKLRWFTMPFPPGYWSGCGVILPGGRGLSPAATLWELISGSTRTYPPGEVWCCWSHY